MTMKRADVFASDPLSGRTMNLNYSWWCVQHADKCFEQEAYLM